MAPDDFDTKTDPAKVKVKWDRGAHVIKDKAPPKPKRRAEAMTEARTRRNARHK